MTGVLMRKLAIVALLLVGYAAYAKGALTSALLDPARPEHVAAANQAVRQAGQDNETERRLAELYWQRYPDVAVNAIYGPKGPHGIFGAREHYQRHGRHEGRVWGLEGMSPQR